MSLDELCQSKHVKKRQKPSIDIYSFIPSVELADYCRNRNINWSAAKQAAIIAQSGKPLEVKHAAWEEIIKTSSDAAIKTDGESRNPDSLFKALREKIARDNELWKMFKTCDKNNYYLFDDDINAGFYNSYKDALKTVIDEYNFKENEKIILKKCRIGENIREDARAITAVFDLHGDLLNVQSASKNSTEFFLDKTAVIIPHLIKPWQLFKYTPPNKDAPSIFLLWKYNNVPLNTNDCLDPRQSYCGSAFTVDESGVLRYIRVYDSYTWEYLDKDDKPPKILSAFKLYLTEFYENVDESEGMTLDALLTLQLRETLENRMDIYSPDFYNLIVPNLER